MNDKIQEIVKGISELSLAEVSDLKDILIADLGITMPQAITSIIPKQTSKEVEKTEFDLVLNGFPSEKKIMVIKEVRAATGLGLIESKASVETLPFLILEAVDKGKAIEMKSKFDALGATTEIK